MDRRAKQIIYGIAFLVFWALIFTGVYFMFFHTAASCFDRVQNQGEEGIDCGSVCPTSCLPQTLSPISLVEPVKNFIGYQNHLCFLATIKRQNPAYAASQFNYAFEIYDKTGRVILSVPGVSFAHAGEVRYIAAANIQVDRAAFDHVDFVSQNPAWIPSDSFKKPQISIQSLDTHEQNGTFVIEGRITNNDTVALSGIDMIGIFVSNLGPFEGVSQTQISTLAPNETKTFFISAPLLANINLGASKVFAYARR